MKHGNLIVFKKWFIYLLLFVLIILFLTPFYLMMIGGFKENDEIVTMNQKLLPRKGFQLDKYKELFNRYPYWKNIYNSAFVAVLTTILIAFFCSLSGFGFAKYNFPGQNILFILLLSTMIIPYQAVVVPAYMIIKKLGWLNTYQALILPRAIPAFGTFLMRQYIRSTIPDDILNAAKIDGCNDWRLYWNIVLPIIKPGIYILVILTFMQNWNSFLWPFVVISKESMYTIPLVVQAIVAGGLVIEYGVGLAACALGTLPILIVYILIQKKFISAMMTGFIKG